MELSAIISIVLFAFIFGILFYLLWINQKSRGGSKSNKTLQEQNTRITDQIDLINKQMLELKVKSEGDNRHFFTSFETLKKEIQKIDLDQGGNKTKIEQLLDNIKNLSYQMEKSQVDSSSLNQKVETLNKIFISNYQRGRMGEVSLNFILESILGLDASVVQKQHLMKNGNRPDVFLKAESYNIPIDSKFPYSNFVKILELSSDSPEYRNVSSNFVKNIREHINKIAKSYISDIDNCPHAVLYLPSQAIFDLIYSRKDFHNILDFANKKKVYIFGPNTLPVLLRLIWTALQDIKWRKQTDKIVFLLKNLASDFRRFNERWHKLDNRITSTNTAVKDFNTTVDKIGTKFNEITKYQPKAIEEKKPEETSNLIDQT